MRQAAGACERLRDTRVAFERLSAGLGDLAEDRDRQGFGLLHDHRHSRIQHHTLQAALDV
jgi:hypothetical protein